MNKELITALAAVPIIISSTLGLKAEPEVVPLATHEMSMANRHAAASVNEVFADNILLNVAYLEGSVQRGSDVNWDEVRAPLEYSFSLKPGETFAYHEDVLPEFKDTVVVTTNAHFNSFEGFKSDGYLVGDGVCHLASLMYWVAKDAGLDARAPVNHDFMPIPGVSREYGVAIYYMPGNEAVSTQQNLYITNNREKDVEFKFEYKDSMLTLSVLEAK